MSIKNAIKVVLSLLTVASANAAISFTGAAGSGFTGQAPAGSLVLFIADTSGAGNLGFLNNSSLSGNLTALNDPGLAPIANITAGQLFGGDTIVARGAVTTAGQISGAFSFENIAAVQAKNFALVWFPTLTSTSTEVTGGTSYGIIRGSDWVLPTVNGGESFSWSAIASSFASDTVFARVTTNLTTGTNQAFSTSGGATFAIVPETSTSLLGAIGALALLRRRRN